MFTGIVEEVGSVVSISKSTSQSCIVISAKDVLENTNVGDSICVSGVCLTVTSLANSSFSADVSPETYKRSKLGKLQVGSVVNLERALLLTSRLGGHIVSGHIDSTGVIKSIKKESNSYIVEVTAQQSGLKYVVEKGSVTLDGVSLTVANVSNNSFTVSLIPHTFNNTSFKQCKSGHIVNVEYDIIGKYVEKLLNQGSGAFQPLTDVSRNTTSDLTLEALCKAGF